LLGTEPVLFANWRSQGILKGCVELGECNVVSVLEHHHRVSLRLGRRREDGARYRKLLSNLIGLKPGDLMSTSEHIAPFNVADSVSALVPLDNRQYPRGFFPPAASLPRRRANIFAQGKRKASALLLPPTSFAPLDALNLPENHRVNLKHAAEGHGQSYAHQLCAVMETMTDHWQLGSSRRPRVRVWPLEAVARDILLELLDNRDPEIMALLFDPALRAEVASRLNGVFCAWGEHHGSFLFWGCRNQRVVRMIEKDGRFHGDGFAIPIEPDAVAAALRSQSIQPGVYLSLLMVCYLPNIAVCGGPKQDRYLRRMISVTNDLLELSRAPHLSEAGYMSFDPALLSARARPERGLHPFGIGLDLMRKGVERRLALEALATLDVPSHLRKT